MTNEELIRRIETFVANSPSNYISAEDAITPALAGLAMYDAPLIGFAAADDALFTEEFKKSGVIHPEYMAPAEWLSGAKTVISVFLPFTEAVRASNRHPVDEPYAPGIPQRCSAEWLHARIEGQDCLNALTDYLQALLKEAGFDSVCPTASGRLRLITPYISTWSERHAAYAAGLGTFGLSRGIITEKGMAGRLCSVITDAGFLPTSRPYSDPFEYCIMCGACAARCPASAIDMTKGFAHGKDQHLCGSYVEGGKLPLHGPHQHLRYGCGKCQVDVPCESRIPQACSCSK